MVSLFSPLKIRRTVLKNRIAVSPMCQYSAEDGMPSDWHFVHYGSFAAGGASLIIQEATTVSPEGRISDGDLGIWSEEHMKSLMKITSFIETHNCIPGIQLAHAGRKASTYTPWKGEGEVRIKDGGWETLAPSPEPFSDNYPVPKEMDSDDIKKVISDFAAAAKRSMEAGYKIIELHMAHGYLVHQFYSPLSNKRNDEYGGSFENRTRLAVEIAAAVRNVLPADFPLFVRISCTDWADGGWNIEDSVCLAKLLKEKGVDLIDCSSGGAVPKAIIPLAPGYQVQFAEKIRKEAEIMTGAVGMITEPAQADEIIRNGKSDIVLLAREMLRNPHWPLKASKELKAETDIPNQYKRAY
jgi:2,4-dienoyl-CoA reductase-like NADH-dependent reductase (Old Yellow Enzyme family)